MSTVTIADLQNADLDVQSIADVVNGPVSPGIVTTRLGTHLKTIAKVIDDISSTLNMGQLQADVADALADAATALANASAAQAEADAATILLSDIASDSLLTPGEKPAIIREVASINNEYSGIYNAALSVRNATQRSNYSTKYIALVSTYLPSLTTPVLWSNLTDNTGINSTTFLNTFNDYYLARQVLLTANADLAAVDASNAQGSADAAEAHAQSALILAGSKNAVFYTNSMPSTGMHAGDLWFNVDTTTPCGLNDCKGHAADANGNPLVGSYVHRGLYWSHVYNGSAWVSGETTALLIASEIAAGAIVTDKLAANAVTADKMIIGHKGMFLTNDPDCKDITAWTRSGSASILGGSGAVDLPTGGSTAIGPTNTGVAIDILSNLVPINQARNYRLDILAKTWAGSGGTNYLGISWCDAAGDNLPASAAQPGGAGNPAGWPNNGTYSYYGLIAQTTTAGWTSYGISFGPDNTAKIPSNARYMRVILRANFNSTAGYQPAFAAINLREIVSGVALRVDGAAVFGTGYDPSTKIAPGGAANDVNNNTTTIDGGKITTQSLTSKEITIGNFDNLLPNPSIMPTAPGGAAWPTGSYEAAGTLTNIGQSGSGYVRKVTAVAVATDYTLELANIPCNQNEKFLFEGFDFQDNSVNFLCSIGMRWYTASGTLYGETVGPPISGTYFGVFPAVIGTVPTAANNVVAVRPFVRVRDNNATATPRWSGFYDLYFRRMVNGRLLVDGEITAIKIGADAIATSDYAESSGLPTAGAKMVANTTFSDWTSNTTISAGTIRKNGSRLYRATNTGGTTANPASATWTSGTYAANAIVQYFNRQYVSLQSSNTNHQPDLNVGTWWDDCGPTSGPSQVGAAVRDGSVIWSSYAQLRTSPDGIQVGNHVWAARVRTKTLRQTSAATSLTWYFDAVHEPDTGGYSVIVTPVGNANTPTTNAYIVTGVTQNVKYVTVNFLAAPGGTAYIDWQITLTRWN